MKRRQLFALGTAAACFPAMPVRAAASAERPGLHKLDLGFPFRIDEAGFPITYHDKDLHIITLYSGSLHLDDNDRLIGKINAQVLQYTRVNLDVSFAVFDEESRLLGVARHSEVVQKIYISYLTGGTNTWTIDFGQNRDYQRVSSLAVAFHDVPIPKPFPSDKATDEAKGSD